MVQNDTEKEWMQPILDFRNVWLSVKNEKRENRDFRRMNGTLTLHNEKLVHGPYTQSHRESMLYALLETQEIVRELAPEEAKEFELITIDELEEIRRIWVSEKHEMEDSLPKIFKKATGHEYPGKDADDRLNLEVEDLELLKEICEEREDSEGILYQLVRDLIHIEHQNRTMVRRSKLFEELRSSLRKAAFRTEEDALEFAKRKHSASELAGKESKLDSHIIASDQTI